MSHQNKSDETINFLNLTIYGKSKDRGFVVDLTKDESESLQDFLMLLHGGSIRVLEVKGIETITLKELISKGGWG